MGRLWYSTGGRHSWRFKKSGAAFVGGYLFAFLETMLGGYVSFVDSQVTLWALLVLIIVLFVRPSGLMPRTEAWQNDDA